jgi:hypothetical protein
LRDSLKNFIKEEKQMMISNEISASSDNEPWFLIYSLSGHWGSFKALSVYRKGNFVTGCLTVP